MKAPLGTCQSPRERGVEIDDQIQDVRDRAGSAAVMTMWIQNGSTAIR